MISLVLEMESAVQNGLKTWDYASVCTMAMWGKIIQWYLIFQFTSYVIAHSFWQSAQAPPEKD